IGSPTMNFVPVTTPDSTAKASGFEVKLPKSVPAGKGTLGFRPETVTDRISDQTGTLEMKVDVVERLGSDQFLYGQVGCDTVTAGAEGRSFGGEQEIPIAKIVGSAASPAKANDFDSGFLPATRRLRDRWTRVYTAMTEGDELPPIDVYRVGDGYYVIDGHHRV